MAFIALPLELCPSQLCCPVVHLFTTHSVFRIPLAWAWEDGRSVNAHARARTRAHTYSHMVIMLSQVVYFSRT